MLTEIAEYADWELAPEESEADEVEPCEQCGRNGGEPFLMIDDDLYCSRCFEGMTDAQFADWYANAITPCPDPLCPFCDSPVEFFDYDLGTESETGYHDAGSLFRCPNCGTEGEPREVVYRLTEDDLEDLMLMAWAGVEVLPDRKTPGRVEFASVVMEVA